MRKTIFVCAVVLIAISFAMKPERAIKSVVNVDTIQPNTLILLRHAKSDKSNMSIPDITRPLDSSGRLEAKEMADSIKAHHLKIDLIVSSPSVRTRQTLEIICTKIGYPFSLVRWDSALYACSSEMLISRIRSTSTDYHTVMFVGHNPSITSAANALQDEIHIDEVKTCGVVAIDFRIHYWPGIEKKNSTLRFYCKPK